MSVTEERVLKQCRLKFQNYYELNDGNMNVGIFVEKFMQGIGIGRCSLRMMNLLSGQLLLLSVLADGVGACAGISGGETLGQILPFYLLGFVSLYLYFSISGLLDVQGKQEVLQTSVTDFLENRMTERLRGVQRDCAYLDAEEEKAGSRAGRREKKEDKKCIPAKKAGLEDEFVGQDAQKEPPEELEELLHEFLA